MTINELEQKVNLLSLAERKYHVQRVGNIYRINPCPVCGHKDHFTIYPETNSYCSFSGCCEGGSVYKFLIEVEGLTEEEAYKELKRLAGVDDKVQKTAKKQKVLTKEYKPVDQAEKQTASQKQQQDFTNWILDLYHKQTEEDKNYFRNRALTDEIIEKYRLCIGQLEGETFKRAILPYWENGKVIYYSARALGAEEPRYKYPAGNVPIFNGHYLKTAAKGETIFICEGVIDALTIESAGYKAIALGGVNHANKLLETIKKTSADEKYIFITAFDNDTAGDQARKVFPYQALEIPADYKDVNEWATKEPDFFKQALKRPHNVSLYLEKAFIKDIEKFKTYQDKKTGFENLDKAMGGLYSGLYIVGGIPSLGKTTFVHQIADQLAAQGEHIIYFSLEQSEFELVSKSISRMAAKLDMKKAKTALAIRSGDIDEHIIKAIEEYNKFADRISIIEGNFATTTDYIRDYIMRYISLNKVKPFVVVDYLQIVQEEEASSDKQRIELVLTELKRISRDFDITIFVISSLNRDNYLAPIDFTSFKESGGIEYTADVIWGLQLEALNEPIFTDPKTKATMSEKRKRIREALAEEPRKIELVCLKNRSGRPSFSCFFDYFPRFDLFRPREEQDQQITVRRRI